MKTKPRKKDGLYYATDHGRIFLGDSLDLMKQTFSPGSIDLIMTSPPFGLVRKKDYGNADADQYLDWFRPFAEQFRRVLKDNGSLVIDIGGAWVPGQPTRSLYHFKLLIMLCEEFGFHLAQEFYWWNPSKLPSPAEWVTVRRIRVKDAINTVWWLSPTPWPRADNRRVLQPYSDSMRSLIKNGYRPMKRPSGHDISDGFNRDNGASIPPNLIALPNTESNGRYQRYCKENGITRHPARFPVELPEYFVRMLTDVGDTVFDPFAGSCVTGEACERLNREWICSEIVEGYLQGAVARFQTDEEPARRSIRSEDDDSNYYRVPRPDILWNGSAKQALAEDGGRQRTVSNGNGKTKAGTGMTPKRPERFSLPLALQDTPPISRTP